MPKSTVSEQLLAAANKVPGSEIIYCYDQTDDLRRQELDITQPGWCHSMCCEWLRAKRTLGVGSTDFWDWVARGRSNQFTTGFAQRMRFRNAEQLIRVSRKGLGTGDDHRLRRSAPLSSAGLRSSKVGGNDIWYQDAPNATVIANKIAVEINNHSGSFLYIALGLATSPPCIHIVAAVREGNKIWYFDPDLGEVSMEKVSLERWLTYLFGLRYKTTRINALQVESFVA